MKINANESHFSSRPNIIEFSSEELDSNAKKIRQQAKKSFFRQHRKALIFGSIILLLLLGAAAAVFFLILRPASVSEEASLAKKSPKHYSLLSGEEISDPALNQSPTFCVQIPNGNDGARPQVGLTQAPVVFEAIAEAGITRFAAIFQNTDASVIGPIRSLRAYYLDWDTPFDCTIVHAGGSDEALANLKTSGHRDLTESTTFMWRNTSGYRAPNNLFTSAKLLNSFNQSKHFNSSSPTAFPRLKPAKVKKLVAAAKAAAQPKASSDKATNAKAAKPLVTNITINFGSSATYNTLYQYDSETNSYQRTYANGQVHLSYNCAAKLNQPNPKNACSGPIQVAPKAIAAMLVHQSLDNDRYHQKIATLSSGTAYIFQNGTATKATWRKTSAKSQIEFKNAKGEAIHFTPGQLWIAAVPHYGSIKF